MPGPRIAGTCPPAFPSLHTLAPQRLPRARGKSDLDRVLLTKVSGTESVYLSQKSAQCAVKRLHEYIVYQGRLPARQVQWQSGSNWHCWYGGRVPEQLCVHALDHPLNEFDIPSNGAESPASGLAQQDGGSLSGGELHHLYYGFHCLRRDTSGNS